MLDILGQPPATLALLALAIFMGGTVKGIAGIGLPILTMSIIFTLDLLPAKDTIAFVVMPILVTNVWQAVRSRGWTLTAKEHWLLILIFVPCLYLGSKLLAGMDTKGVFLVLGCIVAAFAASNMWKPDMEPLS
ncbi:MAG: TSUP family transporter, partial [Rhodospirillales bacterium]